MLRSEASGGTNDLKLMKKTAQDKPPTKRVIICPSSAYSEQPWQGSFRIISLDASSAMFSLTFVASANADS